METPSTENQASRYAFQPAETSAGAQEVPASETAATSHTAPTTLGGQSGHAAPPENAGDHDMASAEDVKGQLDELRKELEQSDAAIAEQESASAKAQAELKLKKNRTASLDRLLSDTAASEEAIEEQQVAGRQVLTGAVDEADSIWKRIDLALEDEYITYIKEAIGKIDKAIADAWNDIEGENGKRKQATDAEAAAASEQNALAAATLAENDAKTKLRQLPAEIKQAASDVTRLLGESRTAVEASKYDMAYAVLLDLGTKLTALELLVDETTETERIGAALGAWDAARKAEEKKAAADAAVGPAKAALTAAEQRLTALKQGRAQAIRDEIAKLGIGGATRAAAR